MQQLDGRVWNADETCQPFHFESCAAATDQFCGRFTVPRGMVAVFTSVSACSTGITVKSSNRVVITRGVGDASIDRSRDLFLGGALTGMVESDTAVTNNSPGFAINGNGGSWRPCRIILEQGDYEVWKTNNANAVFFALDGYTFPDLRAIKS